MPIFNTNQKIVGEFVTVQTCTFTALTAKTLNCILGWHSITCTACQVNAYFHMWPVSHVVQKFHAGGLNPSTTTFLFELVELQLIS